MDRKVQIGKEEIPGSKRSMYDYRLTYSRLGVRQVPEGSGEQGKMEKTGCKIICGAPTTLAVKGLMMMMRGKGGTTTSGNGHAWNSASPRG